MTDTNKTESAALIQYYERVEHALFGYILPVAFILGAFWMIDYIEAAGEWDQYVVYGMGIGMAGMIGAMALGTRAAEVFERVF